MCVYVIYKYNLYIWVCPHGKYEIVRDKRKTNELRESASIIAGVAAVRNASRKPDVDGPDEVGPVLFRTTRPPVYAPPFPRSTSDSDFSDYS